MYRVERQNIYKKNPFYDIIKEYFVKVSEFSFYINSINMNNYTSWGRRLSYKELSEIAKKYEGIMAQTKQQIVNLIFLNWKSFLLKQKEKEKVGMPSAPAIIIFTNQNCKLIDNYIQFPKVLNKWRLKTHIQNNLKEVRIIKEKKYFVVEIVYTIQAPSKWRPNGNYMAIDLGVNNFAAIVSNKKDFKPILIEGRKLKSFNQYYNINKKNYNKYKTKEQDFFHKASKYIINLASNNSIPIVLVGKINYPKNKGFKYIAFNKFISMLKYKAERAGIVIVEIDETYTSLASIVDKELPEEGKFKQERKENRGLIKTNSGLLINSDINAAYQILNKVAPLREVEDVGFHPSKVYLW